MLLLIILGIEAYVLTHVFTSFLNPELATLATIASLIYTMHKIGEYKVNE